MASRMNTLTAPAGDSRLVPTALLSSLIQTLMSMPQQGTQEVFNDPSASGLDLHQHLHPGCKRNLLPVYHEGGPIQPDADLAERPPFVIFYRISRDRGDATGNHSVFCVIERIDLDFG
jgi:hypothetical protein